MSKKSTAKTEREELADAGMTPEEVDEMAPPESTVESAVPIEKPLLSNADAEKLLQAVAQMQERQEALEEKLKHASSAPRMQEQLGRVVTRAEAEGFMESLRPGGEYWCYNPYQTFVIFPNMQRHMKSGDKVAIPLLMLKFSGWNGPGSEFQNPAHPKREIKLGRYLAYLDSAVTVTQEDVDNEDLNLPEDTPVRVGFCHNGKPEFPLMRVIEKINDMPELDNVFFSGDAFQLMTAAKYELAWSKGEQEELLRAKMAELKARRGPGAEKLGRREDLIQV